MPHDFETGTAIIMPNLLQSLVPVIGMNNIVMKQLITEVPAYY